MFVFARQKNKICIVPLQKFRMRVFRTVQLCKEFLAKEKQNNKRIGFVPTMGYLHEGHLSLVRQSKLENDITVCSIFVNPLQFNNKEDLEKYPRDEERDLAMLDQVGCDVAFVPTYEEMYPEPVTKTYFFPGLDDILEGAFRPGHFNGVAIVVSRLFSIVEPDVAYFGKKDYQQYLIVKELARREFPWLEIKPMPIVREPDGLAMSSRNVRLSPSARMVAPLLYQTLLYAKSLVGTMPVSEIEQLCRERIQANPAFRLEYFVIVNAENLQPLYDHQNFPLIALVAAWLDNVRLIDNMELF